jgi:hypothetical protein
MRGVFLSYESRKPNFMAKQIMDAILNYLWTPLVLAAGKLWHKSHNNTKDIESLADSHETLRKEITDAKVSRTAIYDKIEAVRMELAGQHATLRKEQREDFQEVRKAISNIGK